MTEALGASPFSADVVAAIKAHMNNDHAGDSLLICRTLGNEPSATTATMTDMDADGIDFVALVDSREVPLRLAWSEPLTERAKIRAEVTRMYHEACAALGIEPRVSEELKRP